jgi:hypothetical protein
MPSGVHGFVMFCDDIRQEVGGKHSLIGCYQGSLFVEQVPATIQKFGVYITVFEPMAFAEERKFAIPLQIFLPGDEPDSPSVAGELPYQEGAVAEIRSRFPAVDDPITEAGMRILLIVTFAPLNITKPGLIKVMMKYQDEVIELGTLRIYLQTPTPS